MNKSTDLENSTRFDNKTNKQSKETLLNLNKSIDNQANNFVREFKNMSSVLKNSNEKN